MTSTLPYILLESGKNPQHSIIWLHGLGADGHDFVPMVDELKLPVAVRYIFPHAPMRAVTINGGFVMRAWYDITSPPPSTIIRAGSDAQQDSAGIRSSQAAIEALIAREVEHGIAPGNIILAGFSQGGAIVLHTALRQRTALRGVMVLSAYLPLVESAAKEIRANTKSTPVFMAHGRNDPVIPYTLGEASKEVLQEFGYTVEWHEYAMQHTVSDAELRDIEAWLNRQLA
jgi:phospholipase/carboxylesterase